MQTLVQVQKSNDVLDIKVNVVVVCAGHNTKLDFNAAILGLPMCRWVAKAFDGYVVEYVDKYADYITLAKQYAKGYTYTVVIGGNMPLVTTQCVNNIVQYAIFKNCNLVKFAGGYVAKGEYILATDNPMCDGVYMQNEDELYIVENKRQLKYATGVLQDRIIAEHESHGVEFVGQSVVEPTVWIDGGATIFGGNTLKGFTHISSGVILKENNVIDNSFVGANSCLSYSVISNAKIGDNCYIGPFCNIENKTITNNTTIKGEQK